MSASAFKDAVRQRARVHGISYVRDQAIAEALSGQVSAGAELVDLFPGSQQKELLVITSIGSTLLRTGTLRTKQLWSVDHRDVVDARAMRGTFRQYVVASVEIDVAAGTHTFQVGFHHPDDPEVAIEIAAQRALDAGTAIRAAAGLDAPATHGAGISFDPQGPEKAGAAARDAESRGDHAAAFTHYVKAIDRLHDFYVFEQFRNRQPSPGDAWLVDGLVKSLHLARRQTPGLQVADAVKEATHRLRTISTAIDEAGGTSVLYRRGLDGLAGEAPDVDVSGICW